WHLARAAARRDRERPVQRGRRAAGRVPAPAAVGLLPASAPRGAACLTEHRRADLQRHFGHPVHRQPGAPRVLAHRLGTRCVVLAVDLAFGIGYVAPDPHDAGVVHHGDRPARCAIQLLARQRADGAFDEIAWHWYILPWTCVSYSPAVRRNRSHASLNSASPTSRAARALASSIARARSGIAPAAAARDNS